MYTTFQLGPVSFPTGPVTSLLAFWLASEIAARMGKRYDIPYDRVLGLFISSMVAAIIIARLAHVAIYWEVYRSSLLDVLALRPGGLAPWPGIVGAVICAWIYMIRYKLDPEPVAAVVLVGLIAGAVIWTTGSFLTGRVVGTESNMVWAAVYGEQARHPTGLYQALGCALIWVLLWYRNLSPRHVLLTGLFLSALLALFTAGFQIGRSDALWIDLGQVSWLLVALLASYGMWRGHRNRKRVPGDPPMPLEQGANELETVA